MSIVDEIHKDIFDYLDSHYGIEQDEIKSHSALNELGVDSLGLLAIADIVRKKYGIVLDDERIASVRTFQDVTDLLERKVAARESAARESISTAARATGPEAVAQRDHGGTRERRELNGAEK
ncbi:acyl carrier protein [Nocardia sp. CA-129566]|uniref:acyl carrier protein n=1 Tax=Nocardia sp. CA-129566 TaxID=3239976 RepID=UPI003D95CF5A